MKKLSIGKTLSIKFFSINIIFRWTGIRCLCIIKTEADNDERLFASLTLTTANNMIDLIWIYNSAGTGTGD